MTCCLRWLKKCFIKDKCRERKHGNELRLPIRVMMLGTRKDRGGVGKGTGNQGIVVYSYKPKTNLSLPGEHYDFITFTDTSIEYTCEQLCIETAKHYGIGPSTIHLFGLVNLKDHQIWPPLSAKIRPPENECIEYVFRIRFKPLAEKLNLIWVKDREVFMYLYYQMLDDFLTERLETMYFQKFEQDQIRGHALNALVMYGKLNDIPVEKLKTDYSLYLKFLPKSCQKEFKQLTRKLQLQNSLKVLVEAEYNDENKKKPELLCHCFMHDLLSKGAEYMMERYEIDDDQSKVLFVDLKGVYKGSGGKKPETLMWTIDELMSGHQNGDKGVLIPLRYGPPKVFSFAKKEYADSFLGALDGYYRLRVNFYHQLCLTTINQQSNQYVGPPSLKKLRDLKWHGPIGYDGACSLLKDKEAGAYIIKQDTTNFDTHAITAKIQGRQKPCTIPFHSNGGGQFIVTLQNKDQVFDGFEQMLKRYNLTERLRPNEGDASLLLCKPAEILEEDDDISDVVAIKPGQISCIHESALEYGDIVGRGSFTEVCKGKFHRGDADMEVGLKKIKLETSYHDLGHLMEALLQGVHQAMQWNNANIVKVYAVCLSTPFTAVIELAPLGSLNQFLMTNDSLYLTQFFTAAYHLACALSYMDEVKLPHGNIRCRNLLVFWVNDLEIRVKLGDAGLSSLYNRYAISHNINQERLPWMSPELRQNFDRNPLPTIASDVYAFGVTLWEIFMFGDSVPDPHSTPEQKIDKLKEKNDKCPDAVYKLMEECWMKNVEARKKTQEIVRDIWAMILTVESSYGEYYSIDDEDAGSGGILDLQKLQQLSSSAGSRFGSSTTNPRMEKPKFHINTNRTLPLQDIPRLSPPPTPKESLLVRLPMSSGGGSVSYGQQTGTAFRFDAPHNISSSTCGSFMSPTSSLHSLHVDTSFGVNSTTPLLPGMVSPEGHSGFSPSSGATITPPIHSGESTMDSQEPLLPPKTRDMSHSHPRHHHHNSHHPHLASQELPSPSTSAETTDSRQPLIKPRSDTSTQARGRTHQHSNPNFRLSDSSQEMDDHTKSLAMTSSTDELNVRGRALPTPPIHTHQLDLEYVIKRALLHYDEDKLKKLGSGNYGYVFKAILQPDKSKVNWENQHAQPVAVKALYKQEPKYMKEFEREIDLMTTLRHENIVKIIGMCLEHKGQPLLLVMEFVDNGSLHRYLKKQKNLNTIKQMDQLRWCLEIMEGMLYLWEQKVVHRDLATRNVLVTKDIHMKISDFGLARILEPEKDYYKCRNPKAEIPALWCAPEGLQHRRFTTKGDVWSYGVTAWEIFSFGKRPILCEDFREMLDKLMLGHRLDRPAMCPVEFFNKILLEMCWIFDDHQREDLPQVYLKLKEVIAAKEAETLSMEDLSSSINTETTSQTQSIESPVANSTNGVDLKSSEV